MKVYDKDALIIDHRTGDYTTRQLAEKYGISFSYVARIVRGIEQDLAPIIKEKMEILAPVHKQLNLYTEKHIETLCEPRVQNIVDESVNFKLKLLSRIQDFTNIAMDQAKLLASTAESGSDLKATVEAVDRLAITNGLAERHAKAPTNNVQNNYLSKINLMSLEELNREIANLEIIL